MNPLPTSAFSLPDHLTAKADPRLIAGDERHFAAIADNLEQSMADLSERLAGLTDAARRLALACGRAVLRRAPCQPDGLASRRRSAGPLA